MFLERFIYLIVTHIYRSRRGSGALKLLRFDWMFYSVAFSGPLNNFKNPQPEITDYSAFEKFGFLGRTCSKIFFQMFLKNWVISLLLIFVGIAMEVSTNFWLRLKGTFHSLAFSGSVNYFKNPSGRNYWLLSIWKSWIFGSKIFKLFFSDVLGMIEISRYYVYF